LALAQRAYLIVDEIQDPIGVLRPIAFGLLLRLYLAAPIADENGVIALPRGLKTKIVVHASIGQKDVAGKRLALEVLSRIWRELVWIKTHLDG